RRRGCSSGPVPALQDLARPGRGRLSPPDLDQQARDIPHHVVQERVGGYFDHNPFALPLHSQALYTPDRRIRLALGRTKGAEIVVAAQMNSGLGHSFVIEGFVNTRSALL